ncbi:TonB-dependent receptor [Flavobacterium sp. MDT1-60]|uniref:TonB-dependent receptor n=1 Tax=Flavobacterium sp. MDT1-60 TaxID=1979344 RepID=UPI001783299F|nr:TonB-dependent receptor [Flavobacterium sp. MDT1-60]QOG02309.1 TonB-dependent receptor [Flavobacterium sp. MDT1-60]
MIRIILAAALFYSSSLFAQITVKGKVIDTKNNPVELVEILLIDKDSIAIKSEMTTSNGDFTLVAEAGDYLLQIKQMGNILWEQKINVIKNMDLGFIKIVTKEEKLTEVVIKTQKKIIVRKVDRLVFNVENSISAIGGDAIDALKVTPGIKVQNNSIKMIGKSAMSVMINDRVIQLSGDDLINYLKSIPSDNIKSIEVISTPPAKYDAEGNSGILNIQLKKVQINRWNASLRSSYAQQTYPAGSFGSNFSYNKNKLSILFDASYRKGSARDNENLTFYYPEELWNSINNNKPSYTFLNSSLNLNYKLTKKTDIGLQVLGGSGKLSKKNSNKATIKNAISDDYMYEINTNGNDIKHNNNTSININSTTIIDTLGKKFSIDLDYFTFKEDKDKRFNSYNNNILQNPSFVGNNISNQDISNYSAKIDFELPYEFADLSFGSKISFINNYSDASFYDLTSGDAVLDASQSNIFNYKENTQALYFSAGKKMGKKWESKFGLRMETTQTNGNAEMQNQVNKNSYTKFFPSAYVSYQFDDKNVFNLSYSRRVGRPSYWEMNPFRWYDNSNQYAEGNPFLQPSFTNNFQISHSYNNYLNSSIYISKIQNGFGQLATFEEIDGNKIQKFIRLNYFDQNDIGLDESITYNLFSWWSCFANLTVYYSETNSKSNYVQPKFSGSGANFLTTNTITLNKDKTIFAEVSYMYYYPTMSGIYTISDYSSLDFGFKILSLNKKLQISANAYDVFRSNKPQYASVTDGVKQLSKNYYDERYFRIAVKYSFGNNNISVNSRDLGNQDEKSRAGK